MKLLVLFCTLCLSAIIATVNSQAPPKPVPATQYTMTTVGISPIEGFLFGRKYYDQAKQRYGRSVHGFNLTHDPPRVRVDVYDANLTPMMEFISIYSSVSMFAS